MSSQIPETITRGILPGYLEPAKVNELLRVAGIPLLPEIVTDKENNAVEAASQLGFPVVMKVVGPLHKSDVGGVKLNIQDESTIRQVFHDMMAIPDAKGVLLQPMVKGLELFAGVKYEEKFGHLILCGMGGIFIEVLKDFSTGLAPLSANEAKRMTESLKLYPVLKGTRGQKGINLELYMDILLKVSELVRAVPQIREMDLNPLMASGENIYVVDARIRIAE